MAPCDFCRPWKVRSVGYFTLLSILINSVDFAVSVDETEDESEQVSVYSVLGFSGMVEENGRGGRILGWDWFQLVYYLAMTFLILKLFTKIFLMIGAVLSLILPMRIRGYFTILILAVTYYFITSFTAIVEKSIGNESIYLSIIALTFLLIEIGSEALSTGAKAQETNDFDLYRMFKVRSRFVYLSVFYFIYLQFDLSPAQNSIALYFSDFLTWINSIPILSLILIVLSLFYAVCMIIWAFNALNFFNSRKKQTKTSPAE